MNSFFYIMESLCWNTALGWCTTGDLVLLTHIYLSTDTTNYFVPLIVFFRYTLGCSRTTFHGKDTARFWLLPIICDFILFWYQESNNKYSCLSIRVHSFVSNNSYMRLIGNHKLFDIAFIFCMWDVMLFLNECVCVCALNPLTLFVSIIPNERKRNRQHSIAPLRAASDDTVHHTNGHSDPPIKQLTQTILVSCDSCSNHSRKVFLRSSYYLKFVCGLNNVYMCL